MQAAPDDLLSTAQLGFLLLGQKDAAGATPLLDRVLKSGDDGTGRPCALRAETPQTLKPAGKPRATSMGREAKELGMKSLTRPGTSKMPSNT